MRRGSVINNFQRTYFYMAPNMSRRGKSNTHGQSKWMIIISRLFEINFFSCEILLTQFEFIENLCTDGSNLCLRVLLSAIKSFIKIYFVTKNASKQIILFCYTVSCLILIFYLYLPKPLIRQFPSKEKTNLNWQLIYFKLHKTETVPNSGGSLEPRIYYQTLSGREKLIKQI